MLTLNGRSATGTQTVLHIEPRKKARSPPAVVVLAAAGTLTIVPGAIVIWFVRNYIAKGFAMGRV